MAIPMYCDLVLDGERCIAFWNCLNIARRSCQIWPFRSDRLNTDPLRDPMRQSSALHGQRSRFCWVLLTSVRASGHWAIVLPQTYLSRLILSYPSVKTMARFSTAIQDNHERSLLAWLGFFRHCWLMFLHVDGLSWQSVWSREARAEDVALPTNKSTLGVLLAPIGPAALSWMELISDFEDQQFVGSY
jgi:hypothetical protein